MALAQLMEVVLFGAGRYLMWKVAALQCRRLGGLPFQGLLVQPLGDPGSERLRALFLALTFPCHAHTLGPQALVHPGLPPE